MYLICRYIATLLTIQWLQSVLFFFSHFSLLVSCQILLGISIPACPTVNVGRQNLAPSIFMNAHGEVTVASDEYLLALHLSKMQTGISIIWTMDDFQKSNCAPVTMHLQYYRWANRTEYNSSSSDCHMMIRCYHQTRINQP